MKQKIKLGPLIEGTLRKQDTIPAMLNECVRRGKDPWKILEASSQEWTTHSVNLASAIWHIGNEELLNRDDRPVGFSSNESHPWWNIDLENGHGWTNHEENEHVWGELVDLLNEDLAGATFRTHPDDPACLGYWAEPNDDTRGEGVHYAWEKVNFGILMRHVQHKRGGPEVFFQMGDDMDRFQREIGAIDFIWMNDPKNTEGRVFKSIEEHYDAIMEPYFNND